MSIWSPILVGTSANDGTGDPLRTAAQKINALFDVNKNFLADGIGIGINPSVNILDIVQSGSNAASNAKILNANGGTAAQASWLAHNGTSFAQLTQLGTGYTPANMLRAGGAIVTGNGPGGLSIFTAAAQPLYFGINSVETFRCDTAGALLVNTTNGGGYKFAVNQATAAIGAAYLVNSNAAPGAAQILFVQYTAAAPNDTTSLFLVCNDSGTNRLTVRSNGGIANFSANNVNLSDEAVKDRRQSLRVSGLIAPLWTAHRLIDWSRFKYNDQNHDDWNYGYLAQDVQRVFQSVVPAIAEKWDDDLLGVYSEDLHNITGAIVSEAQCRIESLESALAALRAKNPTLQ